MLRKCEPFLFFSAQLGKKLHRRVIPAIYNPNDLWLNKTILSSVSPIGARMVENCPLEAVGQMFKACFL